MQQTQLYPRYMAHQLRTHMSATVVGKLIEVNEKKRALILETDSEAKLTVQGLLNEGTEVSQLVMGRYYELRGLCRSGREMEVQDWTCFGADFDLVSYNQMLNMATKEFRALFYS